MSGNQKLSGYAVVPMLDVAYVIADNNGVDFWKSIWVTGHGGTPAELINTRLDTFTAGQQFSDPCLSPDRTKVIYGIVPQTGIINTVTLALAESPFTVTNIATTPNGGAGGSNTGTQPFWHPDGTKVIYVETVDAADTSQAIRRVDIDGSNDTVLYTNNRAADGFAMFPAYNFDGSRIAFYKAGAVNDTFWTMLADGTGATNFDSRAAFQETPIAWANTQDVLVYLDSAGVYKKANGDGTGITTLWTDPNPFWGNTRFAWLADDSGIVVARRIPTDPNPKFVLTVIDPGGGGITDISPERRTYGGLQETSLPRIFQTRVWWYLFANTGGDGEIVSVAADGSGYTVEQTVDESGNQTFDGFDGREF